MKTLVITLVLAYATALHASEYVIPTLVKEPSISQYKFEAYCASDEWACEPHAGIDVVPYDVAARINREVNSAFPQIGDDFLYGRDKWVRLSLAPTRSGDCEDFALEKRYRLLRLGYSSKAVSLLVSQSHAMLLVHTDQGEMVADSYKGGPFIYPPTQTPWYDELRYVEVENRLYPVSHLLIDGKMKLIGGR